MKAMKKRGLPILLTFALMVSLFAFIPSRSMAADIDSASAWAKSGVSDAISKGFVPYDLQYSFQKIITRAEFCRMAARFVEYATGRSMNELLAEKGLERDQGAFSDTKDPDILAALALGITSGTTSATGTVPGAFSPNAQFSREQAAVMIRSVCRVIGVNVSYAPDAGYDDIETAASWAASSINYCYANGIMNGTNADPFTFTPKATFTREQSIITFVKIDNAGAIEQAGITKVPGVANTQASSVGNWASVSAVQQFAYMDEGIAYAYVMGNNLIVTTPEKTLKIEMKYPLLGDVISDDDGNFYVVWGKNGTDSSDRTVFISKFAPDGVHIKTTGFTGESKMGQSGNTKYPFSGGNCSSAFGNGCLMVNYAREMYSGHQSNNVIGVRISDMSPINWDSNWDIPYTSHSFNQSVIWSNKAGDFLYADHGDGFERGFNITTGADKKVLFHFYLEANADYNMWIVNKTFAQLGGLVETSMGDALVAASAKSISEAAKVEKQNLFVQIFKPFTSSVSPSTFIGGTTRSGATSFDIYDNRNSPLSPVSDYGVCWLTDYTDRNAVAPQVVIADDKIVIMWSTDNGNYETVNDTLYMVLSASGVVLTPATSLKGVPLNSFEQPVYHDGFIYWAEVENGRLMVRSIEI